MSERIELPDVYIESAECWSGCEDKNCPYTHTTTTSIDRAAFMRLALKQPEVKALVNIVRRVAWEYVITSEDQMKARAALAAVKEAADE